MLEKIKQEIVVIIISISSMLITAFATIYGVQITNEHNLKMQDRQFRIESEMQDRQFRIESARKEIEKIDGLMNDLIDLHADLMRNDAFSNKEIYQTYSKKIKIFITKMIVTISNLEIEKKYDNFINAIGNININKKEYDNNLNHTYFELLMSIKEEKDKYNKFIESNPL